MQISKRLEAVAALVTAGSRLADVGTDHGYIPIELVRRGRIPSAIALDVNRGPLQKAVEHIADNQMEQRIETRLSDGLAALHCGEVDSILIAGMGGPLMIRILSDGKDVAQSSRELILQPQSEIRLVRAYLEQEGWQIANENLVLEDGKYYPMMRAVHREDGQEAAMSQTELRYGPLLLAQCHPLLEQFLHREWQVQTRILDSLAAQTSEASGKRRQEVEQELLYLKEALNVFGG